MIEYKIREVTRYIVTRWEGERLDYSLLNQAGQHKVISPAKSSQHGEFDNAETAYAVGCALAKTEAEKLGLMPGDDSLRYPELPKGATGEGVRY